MNTTIGLFGVIGIWITMAMMPLAELLVLTPLQATLFRGASGVVIIGLIALFKSNLVTKPDRNTIRIVIYYVLATLCLFQAIVSWGTNFSALFLDLAVIVPIILAWRRKQSIDTKVYIAFVIAIIGTMLALRVFHGGEFIWMGLFWSIGALVFNGLFIENAGKAKQEDWNKVFWMSLGLVIVGSPALASPMIGDVTTLEPMTWILLAVCFAVATGVLNFYTAFIAFANLSPIFMGVLLLGVTPSIILSSYLILGKGMGVDQLIGVTIILMATAMFGNSLRQKKEG